MASNQELINNFYLAFQKKDYSTMQSCYADNAVFNDAVFSNLNAAEVRAMWEMLCKKGKDLQLDFSNVIADETKGSAEWTATYTFSKTNRKVVNSIKANFTFQNRRILIHNDSFSFYNWSRQALGTPGLLLGWTPFLQNKVRKEAMKNLKVYMEQMPSI